jgi:hypothetical protein
MEKDRKKEDKQTEEEKEEEDKDKDYHHHRKLEVPVMTTKDSYLKGLGPQTGQGSAPASSSSESLGSDRRSASSSARSDNGRGLQAWQVPE